MNFTQHAQVTKHHMVPCKYVSVKIKIQILQSKGLSASFPAEFPIGPPPPPHQQLQTYYVGLILLVWRCSRDASTSLEYLCALLLLVVSQNSLLAKELQRSQDDTMLDHFSDAGSMCRLCDLSCIIAVIKQTLTIGEERVIGLIAYSLSPREDSRIARLESEGRN